MIQPVPPFFTVAGNVGNRPDVFTGRTRTAIEPEFDVAVRDRN